MSTGFAWDRNNLSQAASVSAVPHFIDKVMVRELISKMKHGKAAGPEGLVSEMVKATGEAEFGIFTDLVNQIIVHGVIPGE